MTFNRRPFIASCLLTLTGLCACAEFDELDEHDDFGDEVELRNVAPDPSTVAPLVHCSDAGQFGLTNVPVVIRYPRNHNCLNTLPDRPVVFLLHGNGFAYNSYDYLLNHLAANGFIVISADILAQPDNNGGHEDAAALSTEVLDDIRATWIFGANIDPTRLALIGHSRGGQTVRHLADHLADPADDWEVQAIVALGSKGVGPSVEGDETVGFLIVHGTFDDQEPPSRAFRLYDEADDEESIFAGPDTVFKAMKLLEQGNHDDFSEDPGPTTQAHVTKGYVLAFLAHFLQDDPTYYEDYIRGEEEPHGWTNSVTTQVADGFLRNVIDNFEDDLVGGSTIGGAVSVSPGINADVLELTIDPNHIHDTHALKASANAAGESIEWSIPGGSADTSSFEFLSLRIGQVGGASNPGPKIQLRNAGVWSSEVSISDHGSIPEPMTMCTNLHCTNQEVFPSMGTVRIPLATFVNHDEVQAVRLVFDEASKRKPYIIDNLEFSEWILQP